MKRFIIALMLLLPTFVWAQIPDEEDILRKIMDGASPYYYANLQMRYNNLEQLELQIFLVLNLQMLYKVTIHSFHHT